ncbi:MAG: pentapeptide repeat-containing protein [Anaerolineaceae bacterium]|nr:pentapeptide repeat-containing protein [Anaerolineaceae bacterium]
MPLDMEWAIGGNRRMSVKKDFLQEIPVFFRIMVGVVGNALLYGYGRNNLADKDAYTLNVYTGFLGVMATVLLLDAWYQHRENMRDRMQQQLQLLQEVNSPNNSTAIDAIHKMDQMGWLNGANGLLTGQTFADVNWENADLTFANLENLGLASSRLAGANLTSANLNGVKMIRVNLEQANLTFASMENSRLTSVSFSRSDLIGTSLIDAKLREANFANAKCWGVRFQNADLANANFRGANLDGAKLENAILAGADLEGASLKMAELAGACLHTANLKHTVFDENTTLPNGEKWTTETDMTRFTNPESSDS